MTYHEEEQLKLRRLNTKQAIALAMQGRWQEAIKINKSLIEMFPDDVDAYNRLGRAYMETGIFSEARKAYEQSLKLDPYNTIAKKNLMRLQHLQKTPQAASSGVRRVEPQFIEEAGKSGVVNLIRLASPATLTRLTAGERVYLKIDEPNLLIKNSLGEYIGQVEPRHAQRLIRLIKGGNKYSAGIISASDSKVTVIIREIYQHPDLIGQPSFPPRWAEGAHGLEEEEEEIIEEQEMIATDEPEDLPSDYMSPDDLAGND